MKGRQPVSQTYGHYFQKRFLIPISIISGAVVVIFMVVIWQSYHRQLRARMDNLKFSISEGFELDLKNHASVMSGVLSYLIEETRLQQGLRQGDAERLSQDWQKLYDTLKQDHHITRLSFFDQNRICIFSIHGLGQDKGPVQRHTLMEAARTGKIVSGLELDPSGGLALRAVAPVFAEKSLIGYIELGKDIQAILYESYDRSKDHIALTIYKSAFKQEAWETHMAYLGGQETWDSLPERAISYTSWGSSLPLPIVRAMEKDIRYPGAKTEIDLEGKTSLISTVPLSDASGKTIGEILVMLFIDREKGSFYRQILSTGGIGGVLIVVFLTLLITLLRQADAIILSRQAVLQESEERYRELAEQSRTFTWEINREGLYTFVSHVTEAVIGYKPDEIIGKKYFYDLHPETGREEFKQTAFGIIERKEAIINFENPLVSKAGEIIWVSSSGLPIIGEDGSSIGYRGSDTDISFQKKTEEMLRTGEEQFRTMFSGSPVAILIHDKDTGEILDANPAALAAYEAGSVEELKKNHFKADPPYSDEDAMRWIKKTEQEGSQKFEWKNHKKNGAIFYEQVHLSMITIHGKKRLLATAIDITDRKQAEFEIRKLSMAVEQSPASIVITDLGGKIEYVNSKFIAVTGYSLKEALGKNPRILKSGKTDKEVYQKLWKNITSGVEWRGEFQNRKKNGKLYWEFAHISPIKDDKGEITHYLGVKEDITERKMAEEALHKAIQAANAANIAKSEFLANMSHEIRTPMNAILGFSQLLERDPLLSETHLSHVRTINRSGEHLLNLLNDVLDMSKIEANQVSVHCTSFNLHRLLFELQSMFQPRVEEKELSFILDFDEQVPVHIRSDEKKIRQILVNLIGNAIKFTKKGGLMIRVRTRNIPLSSDKERTSLVLMFEVEDSGIGIDSQSRGQIFKPFQQSESGKMAGGTGLGLAISKRLVEMMGGTLTFESEIDKGSIFSFHVPIQAADEPGQAAVRYNPRVLSLMPETNKRRLLIVDDDGVNRKLMAFQLSRVGFDYKEANNGRNALELFESWQPHAILMDMQMPVMDGYQATQTIKKTAKGKDTPVIAVTASAFDEDKAQILACGADAYLHKPYKSDELFDILKTLLDIEYIYEESAQKQESVNIHSLSERSIDLSAVHRGVLSELIGAIERGEVKQIKMLIREIRQTDPNTGDALLKLVDRYDYETLIKILQNPGGNNESSA